jgi:hypothetical protein
LGSKISQTVGVALISILLSNEQKKWNPSDVKKEESVMAQANGYHAIYFTSSTFIPSIRSKNLAIRLVG